MIIIGDAKRGDISSSSAAYATAIFDQWGFDAVTVNGYMGRDSVEPFLAYEGCGAFVLCKTSNPDAGEFQDIQDRNGVPLYQRVARAVGGWSTRRQPWVGGWSYVPQRVEGGPGHLPTDADSHPRRGFPGRRLTGGSH